MREDAPALGAIKHVVNKKISFLFTELAEAEGRISLNLPRRCTCGALKNAGRA